MKQIQSIIRKELEGYFGSPLAIIFMGTFLTLVLFIFFNVEKFFSRGIADVRPLFQWMPILLIFLLAALTMRQWSEEQRSGTMELMLTLPVSPAKLVLGKFLAVMSMIVLALALTVPIPFTVSQLGNLDMGPVVGGYLAALLMAAAYAAIGLFVSSRTDNQIVALISTIIIGGLFYFVGTRGITDMVGGSISKILWAMGTGSRFESIERGVIDLRDLVYYLSLTGVFLTLNTISLDSKRWNKGQTRYRAVYVTTTVLIILNMVLVNVWMFPLYNLRLDLTSQKEYTISQTTLDMLDTLQEPLLIRAYMSENTHPLLKPLTPEIEDMLKEYEIVSDGMVTAEVVDPIQDPEIEAEALQSYGIRPNPFQISDRHEATLVNAYFSILVRYGDQSVVLNYSDLIDISTTAERTEIQLDNLEYDLTRSLKKVVYGFQSIDAILAQLDEPVHLTLVETKASIPEDLLEAESLIHKVAGDLQNEFEGKFIFNTIEVSDPNNGVDEDFLYENYGILPVPISFLSEDSFYLHMILENGDTYQVIYPAVEMTEADIKLTIEASLKRTSTGFLKTVGIWAPRLMPTQDMFGQQIDPISSYNYYPEFLYNEYSIEAPDLTSGQVPANIDVMIIAAPQNMTDLELYAIDQFLMRGGAVIVAASSFKADVDPYMGGLALFPVDGGIGEMLAHYGVMLGNQIIMDVQNEPFPITTTRDVNGIAVQEIQAVDYPFFVDVRPDKMNLDSPIVSNLPAVTMNWPVTVQVDPTAAENLNAEALLYSSENSWLGPDLVIQPDFEQYPDFGFPLGIDTQSYPMAVSLQGSFTSFFKDKPSPFLTNAEDEAASSPESEMISGNAGPEDLGDVPSVTTVEQSPDTSRLVVFGSNTFVDDFVIQLSTRLSQDRYLNSLRMVQNAVDWSVEDLDLLSIRSRGSATRVLIPLNEKQQNTWEILNYGIALLMLMAIFGYWFLQKRSEKPMELLPAEDKISEQGGEKS
ncbi:MAG: Gldg family protein [Anaerolineaceae bacterium]|nr:Gldg family protein [Anaerolineaceae bacterium]